MLELNLPYLNIAVEEYEGMMYSEWIRQPTHEEHLEGISKIVEFLQRYAISHWIKDSTLLTWLPLESMKQELRQILPAITTSSLKKIACLVTRDFDYMALFVTIMKEENIVVNTPIDARQFRTYKAAADWIADIRA
ncbi:hypothetical protein [Pontibacter ruber]|uniref:STAS/SEC14 domain-containing protein n=1 Tax=Pontibacter ruber TaxID=1343895 RepID=A0ABW5CYT0_9BACT|nr:hypothetical protein [Pontibacter ruber]